MMKNSTPPYYSYLVRFWFVNAPNGPTWRVSVQQVGQDSLRHFPNLEQYFDFINQEMKSRQPTEGQHQSSITAEQPGAKSTPFSIES